MGVTFDIWSALALLGLGGMAIVGMWLVIPRLHGLPKGAPRPKQIRQALALACVQPGETVVDLNAGDGTSMVIAAREFQARAIGFQVEPVHRAVAWLRTLLPGAAGRVSLRSQGPLDAPLAGADVVLLYLTPTLIKQLHPRLETDLRPGARVVSIHFDLEGWQPAGIDIGHLIFLYHMPPQPGSIDAYIRQEFNLT